MSNLIRFTTKYVDLNKVKAKAGKMPTPQESCNCCGVGILPAPLIDNYFQFIYLRLLSLGILATLFMAVPGLAQSRPTPLAIPRTSPNESFKVTRTSGNCPQSIGIWTSMRQYEGGGEFSVIANTLAIASPARLVRSNKKFAEFSAPLKSNFASCVGTATSQDETLNLYSFRLQNGNVIFRVQLPKDTPTNPSEITIKNVISSQPAVRWAIAD